MFLFNTIRKNISNLPGWRTKRKIVIFESDDWGSIRMPSREVFKKLRTSDLDLTSGDSIRYNLYDSLATSDDLSALFETLSSVHDLYGNPPVFTAISLVANPDFKKISACNFREYYYESFTETLNRYKDCEKSFSLWQEGFRNRLFVPQFHGREHLNVKVWMKALQDNDADTHLAFKYEMWSYNNHNSAAVSYNAAFDLDRPDEVEYQKQVILTGLALFEKLHGYKATYFVPPNGPYNEVLGETLNNCGIKYISTPKIHFEPQGNRLFKKKYHYLGEKNNSGQLYLTRNCFFEPSNEEKDWVDSCLNDISTAFKWHKPAVISSHRVNYIGAIDPSNRDRGLKCLGELFNRMIKKWPDVEFMSSTELAELIRNKR